jgi:hypothetical protein
MALRRRYLVYGGAYLPKEVQLGPQTVLLTWSPPMHTNGLDEQGRL